MSECKNCDWPEDNGLHRPSAECAGCKAPQDHHTFEAKHPVNGQRWFVVIDVADEVERDAEDIAMWVELALGRTAPVEVEATVFESVEALTEEYGS